MAPSPTPSPIGADDPTLDGNNSSAGDGNFTIGPTYTKAAEWTAQAGVPQGKVHATTISSAGSQFYPVTPDFNRNVWLYVPAQYVAGKPAPFMVIQDGGSYVSGMPTVFDNLIAAKELPVMLVVFVDPGPGAERSIEYDTVSDRYVSFIETEVLPKVASQFNVTFTTDSWGRGAMGGSSGGPASFGMAWFRPDLYRRIMTYSGSYTGIAPSTDYPHGAWSYHESLIGDAPNKGLRVALEVGQNDHVFPVPYRNTIVANQDMYAALAAKQYHVRLDFALGAGHVDGRVLDQTVPNTLRWLWRGYPIP